MIEEKCCRRRGSNALWIPDGYCAILGCYIIKQSVNMAITTQLGQPGRITLEEALELFMPFIIMEKGYKPETVRSYYKGAKHLVHSCRLLIYADRLDLAVVKSWQLDLEHQNLTDNTKYAMTEGAKVFVSLLEKLGVIKQPFSHQIVLPEKDRLSHQISLSREQFDKLIKEASNNVRDQAILELFYQTGIRLSELLSLIPSDITPEVDGGCTISFKRTKGKRVEIEHGHLDPRGYKTLMCYQITRPDTSPNTIFLNQYGTSITARSVERMVKKYADASSLSWVGIQTIRLASKADQA